MTMYVVQFTPNSNDFTIFTKLVNQLAIHSLQKWIQFAKTWNLYMWAQNFKAVNSFTSSLHETSTHEGVSCFVLPD
ncbi:hypothetical protein L1887_46038 [Cichorium endivia]|nr:hypothetical protein L1887_46038 [Cichorium endivia]